MSDYEYTTATLGDPLGAVVRVALPMAAQGIPVRTAVRRAFRKVISAHDLDRNEARAFQALCILAVRDILAKYDGGQ
jgi:hypothetical protein